MSSRGTQRERKTFPTLFTKKKSGTSGSAATTQSAPVAPAAPSALSATAASSSQINLSWADNANNETGFKIERKTGAAGTYALIATVGAGVVSYQNTGLTVAAQYFYRVRATNASGNSAYSNEANATTQSVPGQSVVSLTLVNADTDQDIGPLTSGMTLNLDTLPTRNLNVRANTNPATVGSVRFAYDANSNFRTENLAIYAFAGNYGADYLPWTPTTGNHTLTATPYTGSSATGTAGGVLTASFTVTGTQLLALSAPSGSSSDSDGDGLLNAYEKSVSLDAFNWDSDGDGVSDLEELDSATGLYGGDLQTLWLNAGGKGGTPEVPDILEILKLKGRVHLNKSSSDSLSFAAKIPALDLYSLAGGVAVGVSVGGEKANFTLDENLQGKADSSNSSVRFLKNVAGVGTKLDVRLKGGSWGAALTGELANQGKATLYVPITVSVDGKQYQVNVSARCGGHTEVGGSLKLSK